MGGAGMTKVRSWVGLDVHAHATQASVIDADTGQLRRQRLSGPPAGVVDFLAGLPGPTRAVYEAGPTGYGLARASAQAGLDVRVCAPGLVPRRPADRVKTDARDADRLARLLMAGELSLVRVPGLAEEQLRDLVRAREDLRADLMRARHRLSKFCLRRELRYPGPHSAWTQPHLRWLEALRLDDAPSRAVHTDYLSAVQALLQRRGVLDQALAREAAQGPFAPALARLRAFRGIDTLSALGLLAEIGDFGRFAKPTQVGDYLGLVPAERSSGSTRRQGAITKAGPPHARRLLVEAAWHYRRTPRIGEALQRRQRGVDPRVCQVAWAAQLRLHRRWAHLRDERAKPGGQVAVACARELSTFLWEAATLP
jgi:transposase